MRSRENRERREIEFQMPPSIVAASSSLSLLSPNPPHGRRAEKVEDHALTHRSRARRARRAGNSRARSSFFENECCSKRNAESDSIEEEVLRKKIDETNKEEKKAKKK